jgi:uncharacterized membrane protein (DUF485 family)
MAELGTLEASGAAPKQGRFSFDFFRHRGASRRPDATEGRSQAQAPIEGGPVMMGRQHFGRLDAGTRPPGVQVTLASLDASNPEDHIHIQFGEATAGHESHRRKRNRFGVLAAVTGAITAALGWLYTSLASAGAVAVGFEATMIIGAITTLLLPLFLVALAVTIVFAGVTYRFHKKAKSSAVVLSHPGHS